MNKQCQAPIKRYFNRSEWAIRPRGSQCRRKAGHGPRGEYCRYHAELVAEQELANPRLL